MTKTSTLFIGYAHLEQLIEAARVAANVEGGPLYGAQLMGLLARISQPGYPIVKIEANVQFLTVAGPVHYWFMPLAEHFENPFTPEELAARQNAETAWNIITGAMIIGLSPHFRPTVGMATMPKGESRLRGDFAGLAWTKTDLWHSPAQPSAEVPAHAA